MKQVMVFAGTTEGYEISRYLQRHAVEVQAYVATEYGSRSLVEDRYLSVKAGRLDEMAMEEEMRTQNPFLVIDATHPYAVEVTENIRTACEKAGYPYMRLLRGRTQIQEQGAAAGGADDSRETVQKTSGQENAACRTEEQVECVYVDSVEAAVSWLEHTEGNILLTTGSKELKAFTALPGYQERIYARVLSLPSVITACAALGIEGKHLIGMQGPFSMELNQAMLRQYGCRYLVTKDTGKQGGFLEKYEAAAACGCTLVIIGRPREEEGCSMEEMKAYLQRQFGFEAKPEITLVGIGMGSEKTFTVEGLQACRNADVIIGARRLADAAAAPGQKVHYEYRSEAIGAYIREHPEYENIVIALSGDVGFYSGARKLVETLGDVKILCGISSLVYFMAKIGLPWEDARITSAHGRACNLVWEIRHHQKVFSILGTADGVAGLARKLVEYEMGHVLLYVGESLSYPEEKIFCRPARELTEYAGTALSVVCAVHADAQPLPATHGLPDDVFIRGKAPMTKEEVRAVSLAKLRLQEDSICYDVGAGTGSVSIEMALRAGKGRVYAIEKKPETVALLRENKKNFAADHLEIVEGLAPEALEPLEAPTHAFIGGSSGNLLEIMELLLEKNPKVRMVINCITLETVSEALEAIRKLELSQTDLVQVGVARAKAISRYHMMMGENPIYIITCEK